MQTSLQKNSNFPERFRKFIRESGFRSTNEFSHYLGYAHSEKISRLFRSPHHKPSYDTLYDIAIKFPTLSVDWLITGRGSMMLKVQHADATSPNTPKSLSRVTGKPENSNEYIPLYELVSIDSSSKKFWENTENILSLIPKKFGMQDCDLAIHVYGNSMCPIYIPGDVILLKEIWNFVEDCASPEECYDSRYFASLLLKHTSYLEFREGIEGT